MANPPIQIGELVDVPAPLSPIQSQWAQEVTGRAVHRFATTAARDAAYTAATGRVTGSMCLVGTRLQVYTGGQWVEPGALVEERTLTAQSGITGLVTIGNSGYTIPSTVRRYTVGVQLRLLKANLGEVTLTLTHGAFAGVPAVTTLQNAAHLTTLIEWEVPAGNGVNGAVTIQPSTGSVDIVNGRLRVRDAGGA